MKTDSRILLLSAVIFLCAVCNVWADTLIISRDGEEVSMKGELLYEALDKSILFETADGQLHIFTADRIVSTDIEDDETPPMDHDQLGKALLADLPDGFKIHKTKNYVIAYQNELDFAEWIEELYEKRLIKEFERIAKKSLRYELEDLRFPLAVVVFGSRPEYDKYVFRELGAAPQTMLAHYSQLTNRVALYDLTFDIGVGERKLADVLRENPDAIPMVTTIIHEGTHQLMFNRGMQTRLADTPLWLNEGMANWFETPDLKNRIGWHRPGLVNGVRLERLKRFLPQRPNNSIATLVSSDDRFEGEGAFDAYAESWALVHFLIKKRKKEFRNYLKDLASKRPGFTVDARTRLAEFTKHFKDLDKLDKAFLRYVKSL